MVRRAARSAEAKVRTGVALVILSVAAGAWLAAALMVLVGLLLVAAVRRVLGPFSDHDRVEVGMERLRRLTGAACCDHEEVG